MTDSLLPPNATPAERSLERATALRWRVFDAASLRALWDADACPADLLPQLAYAMSVEKWDSGWPEGIKRRVIRTSLEEHRLKGTRFAVECALDDVGAQYEIVENPGGAHHTMRIDIRNGDALLGADITPAGLRRKVDAAKRLSVHYVLAVAARGFAAELHQGAGGAVVGYALFEAAG